MAKIIKFTFDLRRNDEKIFSYNIMVQFSHDNDENVVTRSRDYKHDKAYVIRIILYKKTATLREKHIKKVFYH